jgi:DNA-binding response OmpR family regulator
MDGMTVLKRLRSLDQNARVIALTSQDSGGLEAQARELGITDFLCKGISLQQFTRATQRLTREATGTFGHGVTRALASDQPERRVLVVEDDALVSRLVSEFLNSRGYAVKPVETCQQAMAAITRDPPDFIVLDLYLPDTNGIEILRALRTQPYKGAVVVMTGSQDEALLKETLELGSVDIIGKPVQLEHLALALEVGLALKAL